MGRLMYLTNVSVDGYIEDEDGSLDWAVQDDGLFAFITDLVRPVGTYLYGRRLYEAMALWETDPALAIKSALTRRFAGLWRGADKIVYSRSLGSPSTGGTRLERDFNPDAVRVLKATAAGELAVGGAQLAAQAFRAGLVDECHLLMHPVILGGGKSAFPDGLEINLALLESRLLGSGVVYLRYRVAT